MINVTWIWGTQGVERGGINRRFPHLSLPEVIPYDYKNKDELHGSYCAWQHIVSTVGLCSVGSHSIFYLIEAMLNAITRWNTDINELIRTGTRTLMMRHLFNLRAGFKPSDYILPPRVISNPPLAAGPSRNITIEIQFLREEAHKAIDCDPDAGIISNKEPKRLGSDRIIINKEGKEWFLMI